MNFTFGGFILGSILILVGVLLIVNAYHLNHHVLFLGWAEQKWGPGSGTLAYKVIGMILIAFAFVVIPGFYDPFKDPIQSLNRGSGSSGSGTSNIQNFTGGSSVQLSN